IGLVLVEMRDYPGARGPFERALRIQLAAFGPDHPHVATALANLATLERCEGHADLARTLLERALAIFTARLGEQNSATRIVRGALQGIDASR
ncbi:MAG: tetratricopeptide repeat protein, partial [Chloroflexi bacterium]|nr:tetratricopeptide repeat protein [Chloroflexota bacterium]